MAIFRPLLIIFLATAWISFTKQKFRRPFWGSEQVYILFGSKVMTKIKGMQKRIKRKKKIHRSYRSFFFTKSQKKMETEVFTFCVITFKPISNKFLRERGMASNPKMEYQIFLYIFPMNFAMATLGLKEMGK